MYIWVYIIGVFCCITLYLSESRCISVTSLDFIVYHCILVNSQCVALYFSVPHCISLHVGTSHCVFESWCIPVYLVVSFCTGVFWIVSLYPGICILVYSLCIWMDITLIFYIYLHQDFTSWTINLHINLLQHIYYSLIK